MHLFLSAGDLRIRSCLQQDSASESISGKRSTPPVLAGSPRVALSVCARVLRLVGVLRTWAPEGNPLQMFPNSVSKLDRLCSAVFPNHVSNKLFGQGRSPKSKTSFDRLSDFPKQLSEDEPGTKFQARKIFFLFALEG